MRHINRVLPLLSLLVLCPMLSAAQTPVKDTSASISGRVTIGGKAAAGITITASTSSSFFETRTVAKATTDEEGNYRLAGLAAGSFKILPVAKALAVGPDVISKQLGKSVNVAEGESITKVDFALVRGGVVTGRITDAEGNPVIGERVSMVAKNVGEESGGGPMAFMEGPRNKTDDRGVYRIYGLSPGNYKVSVGQAAGAGGVSVMGMGASQYLKTFYPGVQDESKATILEVNEGSELTNIDITPGKPANGFSVSGRVVDADSGQPVVSVYIAYSRVEDAEQMGGINFTGSQTDANGKFRLEGVKPGHYAAFTMAAGQESSTYSDPAAFEMADGDVSGIEIKVHRGATINGVAIIENNFDPAVAAILKTVVLYAYVATKGIGAPSYAIGKVYPDGTFQFTGLAPGKAKIGVQGFPTPPKGLTLVRTEVEGLDQPEGIELATGAQIKGVRLIFAYGTGVVRGEVRIEGGTIPEGVHLTLILRSPAGDNRRFSRFLEIDSRNHFVAEELPAGTYELFLRALTKDDKPPPLFEPVIQTITVANGSEVQATLVVNLAAKKAGEN